MPAPPLEVEHLGVWKDVAARPWLGWLGELSRRLDRERHSGVQARSGAGLAYKSDSGGVGLRRAHGDPIEAVLGASGGQVLLVGTITDVERRTTTGFDLAAAAAVREAYARIDQATAAVKYDGVLVAAMRSGGHERLAGLAIELS